MLYTFFISFTIVNTTPLLKDLYQHITPQYATNWEVIGTLLGLPSDILSMIKHDHMYKATHCCNAMLRKWLEMDVTASWSKLFTVMESPAVAGSVSDSGMYSSHIASYMEHINHSYWFDILSNYGTNKFSPNAYK